MTDSYKQGHWPLFPSGTEYVYSNTTARKSRLDGVNKVVVFGTGYFVQEYLVRYWQEEFFSKNIEEILKEYHRVIDNHLGPGIINDDQIRYLHSLGGLPIRIKALPEGTLCPIGVPILTITNTDPKCYWLTNFLETISQTVLWQPITSATIAHRYRILLEKYAKETSDDESFVNFQAHDFSMRGMSSLESCQVSGAAHLLSFLGTDTVPAILFTEKYYRANVTEEAVGFSVRASEHSIQCSHFENESGNEGAYIAQMLNIQPEGIVSIVADGYDYWSFISKHIVRFKDQIMNRNGKVVIRPDTGDPVHIICGYRITDSSYTKDEILHKTSRQTGYMELWNNEECYFTEDRKYVTINGEITQLEAYGSVQVLYDQFGGKNNTKGYIDLDPHIGLIYGDSITFERCQEICSRLHEKGFASTNVVFGIGSYTYAYNTRDTLGLACKATWVQINGEPKEIFKDPKTGDGMKKSARGLLRVDKVDGQLVLRQCVTKEEEAGGELITIFENGKVMNLSSLQEIRNRLKGL